MGYWKVTGGLLEGVIGGILDGYCKGAGGGGGDGLRVARWLQEVEEHGW